MEHLESKHVLGTASKARSSDFTFIMNEENISFFYLQKFLQHNMCNFLTREKIKTAIKLTLLLLMTNKKIALKYVDVIKFSKRKIIHNHDLLRTVFQGMSRLESGIQTLKNEIQTKKKYRLSYFF